MFHQLRYSVLMMGDSPDHIYIMANRLATLLQLHYHVLVIDDGPDLYDDTSQMQQEI